MIRRLISPKSMQVVISAVALVTVIGLGSIAYQSTRDGGPPVAEAHGSGWLDTGTIIRLMTTGDRVGIGTLAPAGKLEVLGNDRTQIMSGRPDDTTRVRLWAGTDGGVLETTNASPAAGLAFVVNGSNKAHINRAGQFGIGTVTPASRLEVVGNDGSQIMSGRPDDTTRVKLWGGTDGGALETINAAPGAGLDFIVNGSARAQIDSTGRMGVGTLDPRDRLEVSGGNIRVSGGNFIDDGTTLRAPDYVFEQGYDLMSLEELQTYIDQEGHLPNVPSTEDIAKHGLNLSQFQMRLLEKVEELTLYTLHQEKTLRAQQRQIDELLTRLEVASK